MAVHACLKKSILFGTSAYILLWDSIFEGAKFLTV